MTTAAGVHVKVYEGEAAKEAAALALEHHLYVNPSWQLMGRLLTVKNGDVRAVVALAYKDGEPHSVVLLRMSQGDEDVAAYTKQMSRREGLGSACIQAIRQAGHTFPAPKTGIVGSEYFWRNNNLPCPYEGWGHDSD